MSHQSDQTGLLKTVEVAEYLNVSTNWVLRRWKAGQLPGYKLGPNGPLRFDRAEIAQWLDGRASVGSEPGGTPAPPGAVLGGGA